jgi:hypothetical protein
VFVFTPCGLVFSPPRSPVWRSRSPSVPRRRAGTDRGARERRRQDEGERARRAGGRRDWIPAGLARRERRHAPARAARPPREAVLRGRLVKPGAHWLVVRWHPAEGRAERTIERRFLVARRFCSLAGKLFPRRSVHADGVARVPCRRAGVESGVQMRGDSSCLPISEPTSGISCKPEAFALEPPQTSWSLQTYEEISHRRTKGRAAGPLRRAASY